MHKSELTLFLTRHSFKTYQNLMLSTNRWLGSTKFRDMLEKSCNFDINSVKIFLHNLNVRAFFQFCNAVQGLKNMQPKNFQFIVVQHGMAVLHIIYKVPDTTKPLFIIFHKINGYIKDYDRSKRFTLILSNKKEKGVMKNNEEMWNKINDLVITKNNNLHNYDNQY